MPWPLGLRELARSPPQALESPLAWINGTTRNTNNGIPPNNRAPWSRIGPQISGLTNSLKGNETRNGNSLHSRRQRFQAPARSFYPRFDRLSTATNSRDRVRAASADPDQPPARPAQWPSTVPHRIGCGLPLCPDLVSTLFGFAHEEPAVSGERCLPVFAKKLTSRDSERSPS
jgi:hypothetical protein